MACNIEGEGEGGNVLNYIVCKINVIPTTLRLLCPGGWFHGESLPRPVKPSLQLEASLPYIEVRIVVHFTFF